MLVGTSGCGKGSQLGKQSELSVFFFLAGENYTQHMLGVNLPPLGQSVVFFFFNCTIAIIAGLEIYLGAIVFSSPPSIS